MQESPTAGEFLFRWWFKTVTAIRVNWSTLFRAVSAFEGRHTHYRTIRLQAYHNA